LIVRPADAPRFDFEARLDVVDRLLEDFQRIVAGLLLDDVEALVDDPLGGAPLPVAHHAADELAHQRALIERIRLDVALRDFSSSWHFSDPRIADCGLRTADCRPQSASPRSGLLGALRSVLRSALHPPLNADRVERAAH